MHIQDLLLVNKIETDEEEMLDLQGKWEDIQTKKLDIDQAIPNTLDVAIRFVPTII